MHRVPFFVSGQGRFGGEKGHLEGSEGRLPAVCCESLSKDVFGSGEVDIAATWACKMK